MKPRILSLCSGMGLMDKAFVDAGFSVLAGCEIDPEMRSLYRELVGEPHVTNDIHDLPARIKGGAYFGVIGGPPCQSHTKLRAMRKPKFPDLTDAVDAVLKAVKWQFYLFENVARVVIDATTRHVRLDAMHFADPPQSRPRWFSYKGIEPPLPRRKGDVDELMAYSIVAGRIYGPKRGARLQGYPAAADLPLPCRVVQKGLANAVHYEVAKAWAEQAMKLFEETK
jgi:site-specific DNA-cytosine methylase